MTECQQEVFKFQAHESRKVTADFSGGHLSSDGGLLFIREMEIKRGTLRRLAGCFTDLRQQYLVEHSVEELLRQRIGALALGYEDLNDHDRLRHDPLCALMAGKKDVLGEDRFCEADKGKALAGHSTLNRMELGVQSGETRYKKILARPEEIAALLLEEGVKAIPRKSREIVLDFDASDDPLHGAQEGAFFHGYYRHYCYLPLYCFCGTIPLLAKLRDAKRDASEGTVEALKKIVEAIRRRFGNKVRIIVRADSGFAREEIMAWCEENGVFYCLGLARNKRLTARLGKAFGKLYREIKAGKIQMPARRFQDFEYRTRKSWSRTRRVVGKAELLDKGQNPRFIVTNLSEKKQSRFQATSLYEKFYCARGEMENRIKELKYDFGAESFNLRDFWATEACLNMAMLAYNMMSLFRQAVLRATVTRNGTEEPIAQTLRTLRYQLFAKAGYVGREGRHHVLKLNIPQRHREWFEGLWNRAKSFDLPFNFRPANSS